MIAARRAHAAPLDWTLLFRAFREASDWILDVAAYTARDYPDEVAAVERVRAFMQARIGGRPAQLRVEDLLFAFALVLAAIERDLGPLAQRGPWFRAPRPARIGRPTRSLAA